MRTIPKLLLKKLKRVHWNQIELIDWWKTNLRGKGTEGIVGIVVVKENFDIIIDFLFFWHFSILFGEANLSEKKDWKSKRIYKWMKITFWNHFEKTNGRKKTNTRKRMWFLIKRKSNEKFLDGKSKTKEKERELIGNANAFWNQESSRFFWVFEKQKEKDISLILTVRYACLGD